MARRLSFVAICECAPELPKLARDRPGDAIRKRLCELDSECGQQSHEHAAGWIVTLDLPAADVPPIGAHCRGKLVLCQPRILPQPTKPASKFGRRLRRRSAGRRHSRTVERGVRFVQSAETTVPGCGAD